MADSSENLDPKEATEARLCAYLEGELAPAERAEIEQHLASNPQHRQLLADLAKTREWMRTIPTEMAPADLSEVFQQQVERSMLLDETTGGSRSSMNRWPQVVLLAAIVLLVAGLGVVIVAVLRPPKTNQELSLAKSLPQATSEPIKDRERFGVVADAAPAPILPANKIEVAAPAAPVVAATPFASAGSALADKLASPVRDLSEISSPDGVKAKLFTAGYHLPADQKTVCFIVATDSTNTTVNQVRGFFGRHDLPFDDALTGRLTNPMAVLATTAPTSAPSETIYVAHGLTQLQLELLSASLSSNDNLNQTVKRLALSEPPTTAPVSVVTGAISKGQTVSVTIPQLVGPGIETTNVTRVADDGTINLPMIDPLPAAGVSPTQLEQRIAAKYREANLIPQASVTVQLPAATQPGKTATTQLVVATQPTTRPLASTQATTQLAPVDPGINVVVLIENSKLQ